MCILNKAEWTAFEKAIKEPISEEKKARLKKSYANGLRMIKEMEELGFATVREDK